MADQTQTHETQARDTQATATHTPETQPRDTQMEVVRGHEVLSPENQPQAAPARPQPQAAAEPKPQVFKADSPQIPGVIAGGPLRKSSSINPAIPLGIGIAAVLLVALLGTRLISHPKPAEPVSTAPPPQIEVAAPAVDPNSLLPHATATAPEIATVAEMSKPWASKSFIFVNHLTGENVPAMLIRLPQGSANSPDGYWAYEINAAFGDCRLEFVTDLTRLTNDYEFHGAHHPMVGNPCSRALFDPTKMSEIPGDIWVRGALVQGSDVRPPLGIELKVQSKNILALRTE